MTTQRHHQILAVAMFVAIVGLAFSSSQVGAIDSRDKKRQDAAEQSRKAAKAFEAIMQVPDKAIPGDLVAKAKAIAVFPQVIKVAFNVGGEGGRGVISTRRGDGWSTPVFFRGGGASFGAQAGASSTDYFFLLMNDESVDGLMKDKFAFGGEAGVAAGPVGRNAGAGTDALMHAAILSYSRSRRQPQGCRREARGRAQPRGLQQDRRGIAEGRGWRRFDDRRRTERVSAGAGPVHGEAVNLGDFLRLPPAARILFVVMLWPAIWAAAAFTLAMVTDILRLMTRKERHEWRSGLSTRGAARSRQ
jgi:lipid-binding SYLF domain-containing protein